MGPVGDRAAHAKQVRRARRTRGTADPTPARTEEMAARGHGTCGPNSPPQEPQEILPSPVSQAEDLLRSVVAKKARLNVIVARARNGVIGRGGTLPWHLSEDLRHFKRTTLGHPIVMGRRTWESIGRPLPGRRSIVLTRNPRWTAHGVERAESLAQALAMCEGAAEVFVIGGSALFAQALPLAQRLFLTEIDADFEGDTFFPPIDPGAWHETSREHLAPEPGRSFGIDFVTLEAGKAGPVS